MAISSKPVTLSSGKVVTRFTQSGQTRYRRVEHYQFKIFQRRNVFLKIFLDKQLHFCCSQCNQSVCRTFSDLSSAFNSSSFEISNEEKKCKFVGKWKWRKDKLGVSERCHFPPVLCSQTLRNSMLLDLTFHTFSHFHLSRLEFLLFNFFAKLIFSALIFGVTDFSSRVTMRS